MDEVGGAGLHRVHRVFHRAIRGDHHDRKLEVALANFLQNLDTVTLGHGEVEQYKVVGTLRQPCESLRAVAGAVDFVAFELEQRLQRFANRGFVVDDEHSAHRLRLVAARCVAADHRLRH